ncbi:GFA family protein [Devosia sp. 2618]|uniref:GFA family protein n=1 Tax=Devosia sp. 2618 TaxID=3156454 RepID=UPI00339A6641
MTLIATCHCGATRVELPHAPKRAADCNCTFCARTGAIWGYYSPDEVSIVSDTSGKFYSASRNGNEHHFCTNCGIQTWGVSPDWSSLYNDDGSPKGGVAGVMPTTKIFAINLRLIDDFDWSSVTVEKLDGRNSW